jgi:hypothetical protein
MQRRVSSHRLVSAAAFLGLISSASGFAVATATVAGADAPCPGNETQSVVVQGCLPSTQPPADDLDLRGPDEVPTINGIPCTGSNTGTCIGLSRLPSADAPEPDTSVHQSP